MNPIVDAIEIPAAHPAIAIIIWNIPKKIPITAEVKILRSFVTVPAASETAKQSIAKATAMISTVRVSINQGRFSHGISIVCGGRRGIPMY